MESRYDESEWTKEKTSRKLSAKRQIHAAIRHLSTGDYECAVTLSLAAEDQLPDSEHHYLMNALRHQIPDKANQAVLNELRNWLKHPKEPDRREISEFEVAIALLRAKSKYFATYSEKSDEIDAFINWCITKKLLLRPSKG